jgi:hypothetical protein
LFTGFSLLRSSLLLPEIRSEFLVYLLGANEISGKLFTEDNKFVTIDSEEMFATNYHCFSILPWFVNRDRTPSSEGRRFAKALCKRFVSLSGELSGSIQS